MYNYNRFKPGVSRQVHLFAAPFFWSFVGIMLMLRGWYWLGTNSRLLLAAGAIALGTLKSFFMLDKVARRSLYRIQHFGEKTCLGAVYSWKSWLLVLAMIVIGVAVRHLFSPNPLLGLLYFAIGWGLLFSSRIGWLSLWRER